MFNLDYPGFLSTLVFQAKIAFAHFLPRDGYIKLNIRGGIIQTCCFVTRQGQVDKWNRWEVQLVQFNILNWELIPLQFFEFMPKVLSSTSPIALSDRQQESRSNLCLAKFPLI